MLATYLCKDLFFFFLPAFPQRCRKSLGLPVQLLLKMYHVGLNELTPVKLRLSGG